MGYYSLILFFFFYFTPKRKNFIFFSSESFAVVKSYYFKLIFLVFTCTWKEKKKAHFGDPKRRFESCCLKKSDNKRGIWSRIKALHTHTHSRKHTDTRLLALPQRSGYRRKPQALEIAPRRFSPSRLFSSNLARNFYSQQQQQQR